MNTYAKCLASGGAALLALFAILLAAGVPSVAQAGLTLEAQFGSGIDNGWVRVERWRDSNSGFSQEAFPSDGRGDQTGQRKDFFSGDATPHSSRFLLYYAPGWDTNPEFTPVLLVHGAIQNADLAWANPNELGPHGCGRLFCPNTGLMQSLSSDGYKVFAISMAHANGDGFMWSEQIANAIKVIKARTGESEVDIISWSKGAQNARMYVSSLRESWGTAYRGDVRRLIMMGGPNNGFDWGFRHGWWHTLGVYPQCGGVLNGPAPHDWIVCFGAWWNGPQWSYDSAFFPGSAQMLKRWDNVYSLPTTDQDWWTTYHGGWGFYTHSKGIDAFLGESLVDDIRAAGVPVDVRVHNLCGSSADLSLLHNEHTGPSDGIVFIASCSDTHGVANDGGGAIIPNNHLELGWDAPGVSQIKAWLSAP